MGGCLGELQPPGTMYVGSLHGCMCGCMARSVVFRVEEAQEMMGGDDVSRCQPASAHQPTSVVTQASQSSSTTHSQPHDSGEILRLATAHGHTPRCTLAITSSPAHYVHKMIRNIYKTDICSRENLETKKTVFRLRVLTTRVSLL